MATAILVAILAGCESQPTAPVDPSTRVALVTAGPSSMEMTAIGDTVQLQASAVDSSGNVVDAVTFAWTNSNVAVATVDDAGRVISRAVGSTLISVAAVCCGGPADTIELNVSQIAVEVGVSPGSFHLQTGQSIQLAAFGLDRNGYTVFGMPIRWASTQPDLLTVDVNGLATAASASPGVALVRATAGGLSATATGTVTAGSTQGPPTSSAFACLETARAVQTVAGHYREKFSPDGAPGQAFDARAADFVVRARWGTIAVEGDPGDRSMCWAGGYVRSEKPWDASWDDHKDLDGPTRNSAAINNAAYEMTVTGLHYFNVHDGARSTDAHSWLVEHNWGEYVRDDCIENDHMSSGRVFDTLFDGCYTGISTRPSSSDDTSDGTGQLVEMDRVLLRMQPMPYPYKWEEKSGVITADGQPFEGTGIPYGHGNIFKMDNDDVARNPHFAVRNSVFLITHNTTADKLNFPPEELMDACENNTIIWLGQGDYPGELPDSKFPDCFTLLTGQQGTDRWVAEVSDWHTRHPDVGAQRKPSSPGSLEFPKRF